MSERHKRKNAREMLSRAGYKAGGHFANKKMIGESVREHEDHLHPDEPKTKLKLKAGGSVMGMPGPRTHKPRGMGKKKPHTQVNVIVGGSGPKPVPVPVPIGGPPPIGPGAPMPPGGMPGQMPPPGANRGGRFAKGGSVKDSQRDPIKSTDGDVEGKLKRGGNTKAKKLFYGGMATPNVQGSPIMRAQPPMGPQPGTGMGGAQGNPIMSMPGGGPSSGTGGSGIDGGGIMKVTPPPMALPGARISDGLMNKGGKAKVKKVIGGGSGGGLGRLEKADAYGAKVKHGGKTKK